MKDQLPKTALICATAFLCTLTLAATLFYATKRISDTLDANAAEKRHLIRAATAPFSGRQP